MDSLEHNDIPPADGPLKTHNPASDLITPEQQAQFDAERAANQAGWEEAAEVANEERKLRDKILGKEAVTAEHVMHDEALKIDPLLAKAVEGRADAEKRSGYAVARGDEPWTEEQLDDWGGETQEQSFPRLKAKEAERDKSRYTGYEETIFNPLAKKADLIGRQIHEREIKVGHLSDKAAEALAKGDLNKADKILGGLKTVYLSSILGNSRGNNKMLTAQEHLEPALRETLASILRSRDAKKLGELLDATNIAEFLTEGMAHDAGVRKELRQNPELVGVIRQRAVAAIKEQFPGLDTNDFWVARNNLEHRLDILSKAGVLDKDEILEDPMVRAVAAELVTKSFLEDTQRYGAIRLPREAYELRQMGLFDENEFVNRADVRKIAAMGMIGKADGLLEQIDHELRKNILHEDEDNLPGTPHQIRDLEESSPADEPEKGISLDELEKNIGSGKTVSLKYTLENVKDPNIRGRFERNYQLEAKNLDELKNLVKQRLGLESEGYIPIEAYIETTDGGKISLEDIFTSGGQDAESGDSTT